MDEARQAYDELYVYTMGRGREAFILQHVVDAFGAQTAAAGDKPLRLVFSLVGLYLHVEKQWTGRQVQDLHVLLGRKKRTWPAIPLPAERGRMTAVDVMSVPAGLERDRAIDDWCRSVWDAYRDSRETIVELLREYEIQ